MVFSDAEVLTACDYVKRFKTSFYDSFDKQRHRLEDLFCNDATILWNGNEIKGLESIKVFYKKLPNSETSLTSVDGQEIMNLPVLGNRKMMIISSCGKMKFSGKQPENFTQTFTLITDESNKNWKIFNKTHRNLL